MVSTGADPRLAERIARGEYVVDTHAVAEAIVRRFRSPVLVALEALRGPAVPPDEDEAVPGDDLA